MARYDIEAFVSAVRLRGKLAVSDDGSSFPRDSDIISLANTEMTAFLVPWITRAREGHFITSEDITLVTNQSAYTIPSRCVADDISLAQLVDSSGNPCFWPGLTQAELEVAVQYPFTQWTFGQPGKFFFEGNSIVLVPAPTQGSGMYLRLYYQQRPNWLVPSTSVTAITATAQLSSTFTIAYAALPTTGTTFAANLDFECVHASPGFEIIPLGTASAVTATTATFPGTLQDDINVGDSLCLEDTANFPTMVPADLWLGLFAQWVALKIAEINRDSEAQAALGKAFEASEKASLVYLRRRDTLGPRKVSSAGRRLWGMRPPFFYR